MAPSLILAELVARASTPEEGQADGRKFKSYYIIGIVIIALLVVGAVAFVLVRRWKKRAAFERVGEDRIQALSLNVRGIMLENDEKSYGVTLQNDEFVFSKQNMSESDVKPEVSVLSANASKSEILEHYEAEGKLPRPFAPFMGTPPSALTSDHKADKRSSVASWASFNRHSFLSVGNAASRRSSVASFASVSTTSGKDKRTIRQTFNPVLPDELVVSIGERLQLVTSYDDGWCIVGRDSIFKPGEVELGAVPAWCFVKPVKGLRAERPLRTASLGVTINMQDANSPARDNIISWSNF